MPVRNALLAEAAADRSLYALAAANLAALGIAYASGMTLREMMLVYWIQSVVIGVASALRILSLERFDPSNLKMNGRPVLETAGAKRHVALFFAAHYGLFHLVYFMFVAFDAGDELGAPGGYLLCTAVFIANHGYSLVHNIRRDAQGRPSIGALMFLPYARILPMHLTILFGGTLFGGTVAFVLFGVLKTAADLAMHAVEHYLFQHPERIHAKA